jgi:hypothetical protein
MPTSLPYSLNPQVHGLELAQRAVVAARDERLEEQLERELGAEVTFNRVSIEISVCSSSVKR